MSGVEAIALIGFIYIFILFLIAYFGDRTAVRAGRPYNSNIIYALSLAVYCSSWTFYGAVGTAAVTGMDYLTIYLGPILVFLFGYPIIRRIILVSKQNSITSISDFLSSRFGKSRRIAVLVTLMAVAGSLPYIALQLKAVSTSYYVISGATDGAEAANLGFIAENVAFIVAAGLALFTILFGTRHLDATEHHRGMILAVAFESVVKLLAILAVGYYAIYLLLDSGNHANFSQFIQSGSLQEAMAGGDSTFASFTTKLLLSMTAIILLPRQFQVAVVEARDHRQFKTAMWVMPIYLILTSVIVIPIALSGMVLQPAAPADMYVLSLPLTAGNNTLAVVAFIGGLSAATGMVIVAAISLSTMICNDLVMPFLIRRRGIEFLNRPDLNNIILSIRRFAILALILGAYGYFRLIDTNEQLANIGLVSFAAIFQLLPATLFALFWRGALSRGVFFGLVGGFVMWFYTLLLPTVLTDETVQDIFGASLLNPQALLGFEMDNPLTHGVVWSIGINLILTVALSIKGTQPVIETLQASRFFFADANRGNSSSDSEEQRRYDVSSDQLFIVAERIIGTKSSRALFSQYEQRMGLDLRGQSQADQSLISAVQTAIAGVIGTASAQRVISETLLGDQEYIGELTHLVDETSSVLKFNRNLLQTTLQNITHGIAVVDEDLNLVIWNDTYLRMFDYPEDMIYVGKPIREVFEYSASRGDFYGKDAKKEIKKRLNYLQARSPYTTTRETIEGVIIKATGEPMPDGGFVTTYEDITESVKAARLLKEANEDLETRVQERTLELEALTQELEKSTQSKTHFLAAASHDLLQPINAARLFTHSVSERADEPMEVKRLAQNIDQSLTTANDLLRALLDISKLYAGGIVPEPKLLSVPEFLESIKSELQASATSKGVNLSVESKPVFINTDKQLLFSVLLNLVANALRYSQAGGDVILRSSIENEQSVCIIVEDNGIGIEPKHLDLIFNEFFQVKGSNKKESKGLGLGLSIVKRICELLQIEVDVQSVVGSGSTFMLRLPVAHGLDKAEDRIVTSRKTVVSKLLGTKILCLDNDVKVLEAMETLLTGWGCDVVCVDDYDGAKAEFEQHDFEVILADYRLDDEQTGLDFLIESKRPQGGPAGVLITAEQDKSLEDKASDHGFMYLAKPLDPAALRSVLMYLVSS